MKEWITDLLLAVVTAAVPVLTTYAVAYIRTAKDKAMAQGYAAEIADAVADAVAMTSQTYVDSLKAAGTFDAKAQAEAAKKALAACLSALTPAIRAYIEKTFGDIEKYLTTKIEAEVRKQKLSYLAPTFSDTIEEAENG